MGAAITGFYGRYMPFGQSYNAPFSFGLLKVKCAARIVTIYGGLVIIFPFILFIVVLTSVPFLKSLLEMAGGLLKSVLPLAMPFVPAEAKALVCQTLWFGWFVNLFTLGAVKVKRMRRPAGNKRARFLGRSSYEKALCTMRRGQRPRITARPHSLLQYS
jgi:hypothetical protein